MNIDASQSVSFFTFTIVAKSEHRIMLGSGVTRCIGMKVFNRQKVLKELARTLKNRTVCIEDEDEDDNATVNILSWKEVTEEEYINFNEYTIAKYKEEKDSVAPIILHYSASCIL